MGAGGEWNPTQTLPYLYDLKAGKWRNLSKNPLQRGRDEDKIPAEASCF
jgi:hypothetical protein